MMTLLAILGGLIGLAVTASAVLFAWSLYSQRKPEASTLLRWTFFDYALFALFMIGSLFLFTDLIAVLRDSESYPPYHYGYLLCGFIFTFAGMVMMALRLAVTVSMGRAAGAASMPNHQHEPSQAEQAE
ncbi:hypothetical protein [Paenibacillus cremeus]|uniref:Uncharacterized protein n=1 Tax=Paenibacillus cremeus TaxID=2163881 RepID=A0A559K831_9BACL|nr:hypothetical protein [Paenibacillus cremeus]TVY08295.1 hypothetical protein FPZ49_19715 [Paenibacillus cremeus]